MEAITVKELNTLLPIALQHKHIWTAYDEEADTLYVHLKKPNHADRSEMTDDDIIVRYEQNAVIGYTILNASLRLQAHFL